MASESGEPPVKAALFKEMMADMNNAIYFNCL